MEECTFCGGPLVFMGRLGALDWFRCRNCGLEFNELASAEFEDETFPVRGFIDYEKEETYNSD